MTKIQKILAIVIALLFATVAFAQTYRAGQRAGFQACQDQF